MSDEWRRNLYAAEGLRYMPKVLAQLDQNPLSPTYGCGDRPYWLNKAVDFPCGMYGEFALPLALAYKHPFPDSPYQGQARVRELSLAVMRFQAKSAHPDGANDDFYPFERAVGSTAFALYTCAEAAHQLGVMDDDILSFLVKRARWLGSRHETGRLSNHHALAAVGIAAVHRLTGGSDLKKAVIEIRDRLLDWQDEEGWFPEYDGFDPGYDTFTIGFLAHLRQITGDDTLTGPLRRAVELAGTLVAPDGTFGGEIGNRNSYHFVPFGFELLAPEMGAARFLADRCLEGLASGRRAFLEDNRAFSHYQYNFLQAWLAFADRGACPGWSPPEGLVQYPRAGLVRVSRDGLHAVVSTRKGGVVKAATAGGPLCSDTGLVVLSGKGRPYAPAVDGTATARVTEEGEAVVIEVQASYAKVPNTLRPTPLRMIALRLLNLTLGRVSPNLLRGLIQHLLIKRKKLFPMEIARRIRIDGNGVEVHDDLRKTGATGRIARLMASSDLTTVFTASSNPWHVFRFLPWTELETGREELERTGRTVLTRRWTRSPR